VKVLQGERQRLPAGCATVKDVVHAAKERASVTGIHSGHLARSWFREWLLGRLAKIDVAQQKAEKNKLSGTFGTFVKPLEAGSGHGMDVIRERFAREMDTWDATVAQRSRLRTFAGSPA
jgi:hypothetical protein